MYIHNRHFIIIKVVMSDYDNIKYVVITIYNYSYTVLISLS